jgi:hypothetical protein
MKPLALLRAALALTLLTLATAPPAAAQFGRLGRAVGRAAGAALGGINVDQLTGNVPITTSLEDARWADATKDGFVPREARRSMMELQRTPNGGFVLQPGYYFLPTQSYCLKAGTHGPGGGDGYLYAPPMGPAEDHVMTIVRNSVNHPEIEQSVIQRLLWAIIARARFEDLTTDLKAAAARLLTPRQIATLNRSALDLIPGDEMGALMNRVPGPVRQVVEAEAQLRRMLTDPGATFAEMERTAVLAGMVGLGPGSREVPSGRWSLHPEGYHVRYIPRSYSRTLVEVWVPQGSPAVGKEYDPATHIAVPGNTARQRLMQSGRAYEGETEAPPVAEGPVDLGGETITTTLADARWIADAELNRFTPREAPRSLLELQRTPNGGFVMQPGYYTRDMESFSLSLGAYGPAAGDGFLFAPPKGPSEDPVMTILRNAVNRPEIDQATIQQLLWAVLARARFEALRPELRAAASRLLTPRQLTALNTHGIAAVWGSTALNQAIAQAPAEQRPRLEAEAKLRLMLTDGSFTYWQMEQTALTYGAAPTGPGSRPVADWQWNLHPDGYYVRYRVRSYRLTGLEIWVPQGSPAVGKELDPATHVAVPGNPAVQRLILSARTDYSTL